MKTKLLTTILLLCSFSIFAQNYEQRGDSLFAIGQYEKAIKQYNAAIEVVGESSLFKRYELKEKISKADNLQQQSTLRYLNLNMIGTIGTSRGTLVYKEKSDNGYYTYQLSKTIVKRTIRKDSYNEDRLLLKSYDLSGKYIGTFKGVLNHKGNSIIYSGTFTNYKGASVKFNLKQK